jgi:hypothetical protein
MALVWAKGGHMLPAKGGTQHQERPMTQHPSTTADRISAEDALRLLTEAWAYYTPRPRLVTAQNSQPSPVFDEYYAA